LEKILFQIRDNIPIMEQGEYVPYNNSIGDIPRAGNSKISGTAENQIVSPYKTIADE